MENITKVELVDQNCDGNFNVVRDGETIGCFTEEGNIGDTYYVVKSLLVKLGIEVEEKMC